MKIWKRTQKVLSMICCLAMLLPAIPTAGATDSGVNEDLMYQPSSACGTYLGKNADGVYEFEITIPDDGENQPKPLVLASYFATEEISNSVPEQSGKTVIATRAGYFYGCYPGTADISYSVYQRGEVPKLKAVVHVTVLAQEDYDARMDSASTVKDCQGIPGYKHHWYYDWTLPTCEREGNRRRHCSMCKEEEILETFSTTGHSFRVAVKAPTQARDGMRTYTCSNCGYKYTETIPALDGGAFVNPDPGTAADPGTATDPGTAADPGSTTAPGTAADPDTTTQPGETGSCANGHSWSEARTVVKATCVQEGRFEKTCKICGETETGTIPKTDHSWVNKTEAATFEKAGREYRVCSVCGKDETIKVLPKLEQQPSATAGSGSASLSKLSKQEIVDLLNATPTTTPSDIFVTTPSCTDPYAAGKVRQEVLDAAAARLSALRRIAGLPAVTADPELCEQAQYGAVILGKLGTLNHHPSKPADMDEAFYRKAYSATSTSNLYAGLALLSTPDGFMDDSDGGNVDRLGHRRWQLNPALSKVGFGYVANGSGYGRFTAEKVFDRSGRTTDYNYVAWPASGNFPSDLSCFENTTAWSVSLNPSRYQKPSASAVTVSLTRESDGKTWSFSGRNSYQASSAGLYFNINNDGYGVDNCIIFRPDGISKYEGVYTVSINGLRSSSGSEANLSYQVDFFSTKDIVTEPTKPETPTTPTEPTTPTTPTTPAQTKTANPTNDKLTVNGILQNPTVYKISGSNYFKIRDVAAVLNGTEKQFSVGYSGGKVTATSGQPYESTGKELTGAPSSSRTATRSNDTILINGKEASLTVYKIGGSNYFKLRDLGDALGFSVDWVAEKGVIIETN